MQHPAQWPYQRIAGELRAQIASGELAGQLPSRMALAERYGVASMTVQHAIDVLKGEGVVYAVPGMGVFVSQARDGS